MYYGSFALTEIDTDTENRWGSPGGGLCKGGAGGSPGGVSVRETPPYGKKWVVRILLECVLVLRLFLSILTGLRNLAQLTWLNVSGNRLKVP